VSALFLSSPPVALVDDSDAGRGKQRRLSRTSSWRIVDESRSVSMGNRPRNRGWPPTQHAATHGVGWQSAKTVLSLVNSSRRLQLPAAWFGPAARATRKTSSPEQMPSCQTQRLPSLCDSRDLQRILPVGDMATMEGTGRSPTASRRSTQRCWPPPARLYMCALPDMDAKHAKGTAEILAANRPRTPPLAALTLHLHKTTSSDAWAA
jgi:hypothetical protein